MPYALLKIIENSVLENWRDYGITARSDLNKK